MTNYNIIGDIHGHADGRVILDGEWRCGLPEEISSEDWNLVIAYAHLAEGIGIEKLSRGVDEALLPASKDRLRRTLALASRFLVS